ncbi:MAG: 50S ribosomal protein L2 [Candidatus Pacearchaeota archaeon]
MGKNIIQQARGHGSLSYRVRRKAFRYKVGYPPKIEGEGEIIKIIHSTGHSAPIIKIRCSKKIFYNVGFLGAYEGQKISIGKKETNIGDITELKNIPTKSQVYNIESSPYDGGKFVRSAGSYASIKKKEEGKVILLMPSKKEKEFDEKCRATIGIVAGGGRKEKPVIKAGKMFYIKKSRNKLWPRTSAVKMNVIDHPFGSGRGKNLTHGRIGKIPKRNAPPGAKVGSVRARRTGRGKRSD